METDLLSGARKALLAVFAHPDDESFGPGGTLARYAREGTDVRLVCATDGDAGTVSAEMLAGYSSTSQLRAAELCCAAQELGLKGIDWLGYRDSGMAGAPENQHPDCLVQAPMERVVGQIVASIRRHRPQVVITDNPHGSYGHPDHIKLHHATVEAFAAASDPAFLPEAGPPHQPARLDYTTLPTRPLKWLVRLMPLARRNPRRFGRNGDIDLLQVANWQTAIHARIDVRRYYEVRLRASACHRSQGNPEGEMAGIPRALVRQLFGFEYFTQGWPIPRGGRVTPDLFPA